MLSEVDALRYDRKMSNGKTKPVLLACERATGEEVEVIAKFSKGCDNSCSGLIREAISASLAKDLGLPIPRPYVVNITPEFIKTIPDEEISEILSASCAKGFGSERMPDGYSTWVQPSSKITGELLTSVREVIAFDAFTTNADRRRKNPNLLFNGNQIAMIDHEMLFMTDLNLFWKAPWIGGGLDGFYGLGEHTLFDVAKGTTEGDFTAFLEKLEKISDVRINEYAQAIPSEWLKDEDSIYRAVNYIRELRNNIRPAILELTKALS